MNRTTTSRFGRTTLLVFLAVASAAILTGCGGEAPSATPKTPAPAASEPVEAPTMQLIEPLDGATVPAGDLKVNVETTGHKFTMASNNNVDGEGHVHYTLDGRPFQMSITPDAVIEDVEPGVHTLEAELVQNNTQPFDPPVREEITFTAE